MPFLELDVEDLHRCEGLAVLASETTDCVDLAFFAQADCELVSGLGHGISFCPFAC
jgi:hypothetical protein